MNLSDILRHPKTLNELKAEKSAHVDEDIKAYNIKIRTRYIPTAWDDNQRNRTKNWKSNRKTQYKSISYG